jgi:hypothetical protein
MSNRSSIALRILVWFGVATRTAVLLYFIASLGRLILLGSVGRTKLETISAHPKALLILGLLLLWLFRPGTKHYRAWGVAGVPIWLAAATWPCWLERHFPGQDFGSAASQETGLVMVLKGLQAEESRFYSLYHRYCGLDEIPAPGVYVMSAEKGFCRPAMVHLFLRPNGYTLTATGSRSGTYSCWIGCPLCSDYYGDESGVLRVNHHCRTADSRSSPVR